jgi:isocitrate/isopropylmalate dehydrogenase
MEHDDLTATGAYVDAAAALLKMPPESFDRAAVVTVIERLAAYAADLAAVELADEPGR